MDPFAFDLSGVDFVVGSFFLILVQRFWATYGRL